MGCVGIVLIYEENWLFVYCFECDVVQKMFVQQDCKDYDWYQEQGCVSCNSWLVLIIDFDDGWNEGWCCLCSV